MLPRGFVKIRHFGFLANRGREDNIRLCRTLLDAQSPNFRDAAVTRQAQPNPPDRCPLCNEGSMQPVEILLPQASALRPRRRFRHFDAIPHEAARATTFPRGCLRDSRSCMGTFRPDAKSGIKLTCGTSRANAPGPTRTRRRPY